jgi:hypothetical protein
MVSSLCAVIFLAMDKDHHGNHITRMPWMQKTKKDTLAKKAL